MQFYVDTAMYVIKTFPFDDQLLSNAKFINFETRLEASFECVQYFVQNFLLMLNFSPTEMDTLEEQFKEYQLLDPPPMDIIKNATTVEEMPDGSKQESLRMDIL
ncbi:hypothetical protein DPMN_181083 [Dreissena polymorpha]|uniref:Uncharacterized protein n=1 Tax=Dreissena polymorpha TaxID=45954 RepID=A0A9D4DCU6_DREPO|nr:hypothetical protein DPMN_181083 [Dreissena polymorpha]